MSCGTISSRSMSRWYMGCPSVSRNNREAEEYEREAYNELPSSKYLDNAASLTTGTLKFCSLEE